MLEINPTNNQFEVFMQKGIDPKNFEDVASYDLFGEEANLSLVDFLRGKKDDAAAVKAKCKNQIKANSFLLMIGSFSCWGFIGNDF